MSPAISPVKVPLDDITSLLPSRASTSPCRLMSSSRLAEECTETHCLNNKLNNTCPSQTSEEHHLSLASSQSVKPQVVTLECSHPLISLSTKWSTCQIHKCQKLSENPDFRLCKGVVWLLLNLSWQTQLLMRQRRLNSCLCSQEEQSSPSTWNWHYVTGLSLGVAEWDSIRLEPGNSSHIKLV